MSKDLKEVRKAALQLSGGNSFQAKRAVSARALRREWKSLSCWEKTRTGTARTDCLWKEGERSVWGAAEFILFSLLTLSFLTIARCPDSGLSSSLTHPLKPFCLA